MQSIACEPKIVPSIKFGWTKTQAIITSVTGQVAEDQLIERLKLNKFPLIIYESTDTSITKHFALIARTAVAFKVQDTFLGLIAVTDSSATALHNECKKFFEERNIPYKLNMIGFPADGCNC